MTRALQGELRAPVSVCRAGAGPLLRHRFLLLGHRGRRSGRLYRTVLEVLCWHDDVGEAIVMSGFGPQAHWLQNVFAGGAVDIRICGECWPAAARRLDTTEAAAVLADYEQRNGLLRPLVLRLLSELAGVPYDGSPAGRLAVVEALPLVAFRRADHLS